MSAELLGIARYCSIIQPGWKSFKYAPANWLTTEPVFDQMDGTIKGDFVFNTGDWLEAFFVPSVSKPNLSVKKKTNDHGNFSEIAFSGIFLIDNAQILAEFEKMANSRFILLIDDKNNRQRICGTKKEPLNFGWDYAANQSQNRYNFEFKGFGKRAPLYYAGPV